MPGKSNNLTNNPSRTNVYRKNRHTGQYQRAKNEITVKCVNFVCRSHMAKESPGLCIIHSAKCDKNENLVTLMVMLHGTICNNDFLRNGRCAESCAV